MDGMRFDSLAKAHAATAGSRRRLLGAVATGLLGGTAAAIGGVQAAAKKRKKKKKKPTCKSGILVNGRCCTPTTCAAKGTHCGELADGCGGTLQCGSCDGAETCGGGNPGTPGVCGCTGATCAAGQCGQPPDGCGGTLTCFPPSAGNACWILAGSDDPFGPDARIRVADDLTVSINGQVLARDDDGRSSEVGPFIFSAQFGDQLRVVASAAQTRKHELGALYLRSAGADSARKLTDAFVDQSPGATGTFLDETFRLCLSNGETCSSSTECCSRSCCGSETDPARKCRGGCG